MWEVRTETPEDFAAIREVNERAFAPSTEEPVLVESLRAAHDHEPELCLVALKDGAVVGHIMFSRGRLSSGHQVLVLAPMAVVPELQNQGVGSALVEEGLRRAAETDFPLVSVLGHEAYYPRFGFMPAGELGIEAPFPVPPAAWMAYRLPAYESAAHGVLNYADAFTGVT